jgi:hypothetical protein
MHLTMLAAFTIGIPLIFVAAIIGIAGCAVHAILTKDLFAARGGAIVAAAVALAGLIIGTIFAST